MFFTELLRRRADSIKSDPKSNSERDETGKGVPVSSGKVRSIDTIA